jgi:hypothetical protein
VSIDIKKPSDLMKSLISTLNGVVTGGDEDIKLPKFKFVSWFLPGIPFEEKDFEYLQKGLIGQSAEETRQLADQAFNMSKILDFIPSLPPISNDMNEFIPTTNFLQTIFASSQDSISAVWNDVLKFSKVLKNEISEDEEKELKEYRKFMNDNEEKYLEYMEKYIKAANTYKDLKKFAMIATGNDEKAKEKVLEWQYKSEDYFKAVKFAEGQWNNRGHRLEYEEYQNRIAQLEEKSMVSYKERLKDIYQRSINKAGTHDSDYLYTALIPGNFAKSEGWTDFYFFEGNAKSEWNEKMKNWKAGARVSWFGLFSAGGSGGQQTGEENENQKCTGFKISFKFVQIPVIRPWFEPAFFSNRAWTLDKSWDLAFDKPVSDGKERPAGRLIAYPVSALFVKDVEIGFLEVESASKYISSTVNAEINVGFGPFLVGGGYSSSNAKAEAKLDVTNGKLTIKGIQLIGFVNNFVPRSPNLNPEINPEQLVGGSE